jgi:hypothetical protein
MEASAFLQICEYNRDVKSLGIIKGVADMGETSSGENNDQQYRQAVLRAARAAKAFVKWMKEIAKEDIDRSESGIFKAF